MKKIPQTGFVLIMAVFVLATLLILGSYILSISHTDNSISTAQSFATKNYYLAEAGINDMLWKIQNDTATKEAFLTGTLNNSYTINRENVFGDDNASYTVAAFNTAPTEAWVIATSTYQIGSSASQRVVKTYITKPIGSAPTWEFGLFAGGRGNQQNGNFTFTGAGIVLVANGGRLHSNQVFKVQGSEVVVNGGSVTSSNVINIVAGGKLTLNNSVQESPTTTVDMLQIDFDSDDPNSWKNRATVTYTQSQFQNLPNNTTLNGIIYVTGDANVTGKNMTINGVLVAKKSIKITNAGRTFRVNADSIYGGGLLAKEDVNMTTSGGTVLVNGIIYAGDDLDLTSAGTNFTINGSMNGFDARVTSSGGSIILNYTPENFNPVIQPEVNPNSPIIQISHWEEQY
jgi:Tfp pilus assembly protein PilX